MNEPAPAQPDFPEPYLDFIHDTLWSVEIHAQVGQRYATLGDLAGLNYALRCLAACARAAISTMTELREATIQQQQATRPERQWTTREDT